METTIAQAVADAPDNAGFITHEFAHGASRYVYSFELITLEQGQLASEVVYFKKQQIDRPAKSVNDMLLSGAGEYLIRAFAYLLTEVDATGGYKPFDRVRGYDAALRFARALPMSENHLVQECIEDFFTRTGRQQIVSDVLLREPGIDVNALLESALRAAMTNGSATSNVSASSAHSTDPSNSTDGSEQP